MHRLCRQAPIECPSFRLNQLKDMLQPRLITIRHVQTCQYYYIMLMKDDVVHIEWKDTNESHTGCFEVEWLRDNCYQTAMKMSTRMSRNKPTSPVSSE